MFAEELSRITPLLTEATIDTIIMVIISLSISALIGIPLGVLLVVTRPGNIFGDNKLLALFNFVLGTVLNMIRAIPFIILMVALIPLTRLIMGTTFGVEGAIFPLIVFSVPFISRVTETAILEVKKGIIEAFIAMGASPWQIITKVLLRESRSGLLLAMTTAAISLIGATAMAGTVGAGGLGDLALRYGYQRYDNAVMIGTLIILVIVVQGVQSAGNYFANRLRK